MAEGFKIADGYLRVYTDYTDAQRQEREFLRESDQDLDRASRRQVARSRETGRRSGDGFGEGFLSRLRHHLGMALNVLGGFARAAAIPLMALAKLAGLGLLGGAIISAIGGIGGAIAGLIPLLGALAKVAATAAGSLLLIPAALTGLLITIGAVKFASMGLGDAFKALGEDAEKFNEATKKLDVNARKALEVLRKYKPTFDSWRLRAQHELFALVAKDLDLIGKQVLPIVGFGLTQMARVLNEDLRIGLQFLLDAVTQRDLATIFANAAATARNFGAALRPALQALRDIVVVGSGILREITGGLGTALGGFAKHISDLRASGGLAAIIRDGLDMLGQFKDLAGDVFGILKGIFTAADSGEEGGVFRFFDRLNKLINTPEMQEKLGRLFDSLFRAGQAVLPVLTTIVTALVPLIDAIARISESFGPHLVTFFEKLGAALLRLEPAFIALAPLLDVLGDALGPVADILAGLVVGAAPGMIEFVEGLAAGLAALAPAAKPVGEALGDLLKLLGPLLPVLGQVLGDTLVGVAGVLSLLARTLTPIVVALLPKFVTFWTQFADMAALVLPALTEVATAFLAAFAEHLPEILLLLDQLVVVLLDDGAAMFRTMLDSIKALVPLMPPLVNEFIRFLTVLIPFLDALRPVFAILGTSGLPMGILFLIGIMRLFETAMMNATAALRLLTEVGRFLIDHVILPVLRHLGLVGDKARESVGRAGDAFRALPGTILAAVGHLGSLLFNAGRDLVTGLWNGIKSLGGWLGGQIGGFVRQYVPGPVAKILQLGSPSRLMFGMGRDTVRGYVMGVEAERAALMATMAGITDTAVANVAPPAAGAPDLAAPRMLGPYVIQIGDRAFAQMVIDAVTGEPVVISETADEGARRREFTQPRVGSR